MKIVKSTLVAVMMCGVAQASLLYSIATADGTQSSGYNASFVSVTEFGGITGTTAEDLGTNATVGSLRNFESSASTTLGGIFGTTPGVVNATATAIADQAEFDSDFVEFTVLADSGTMDLTSLMFNSTGGGSSGARGFEMYATVNGGAFNFADIGSSVFLLADVDDDPATSRDGTL